MATNGSNRKLTSSKRACQHPDRPEQIPKQNHSQPDPGSCPQCNQAHESDMRQLFLMPAEKPMTHIAEPAALLFPNHHHNRGPDDETCEGKREGQKQETGGTLLCVQIEYGAPWCIGGAEGCNCGKK